MNIDKTSVPDRAAVVDVLKRIEARIGDSSRWTFGDMARDTHGRSVSALNPAATRWCLDGAAYCESNGEIDGLYGTVSKWLRHAARSLYPESRDSYTRVNDDLGHDAVMAVVRRAIEIAESEARS